MVNVNIACGCCQLIRLLSIIIIISSWKSLLICMAADRFCWQHWQRNGYNHNDYRNDYFNSFLLQKNQDMAS